MIETFFIVLFITVSLGTYAAVRQDGIDLFILLSSAAKLLMCIAGLFFILPFSGDDAVTFQAVAARWSEFGFFDIIETFDFSKSYVFVTIIALLYWLMDVNIAIPVFLNGILGVLIFYFSHVLVKIMWKDRYIPKAFYLILALHPMLTINSAVVLRENFVILFMVLAAIYLARFSYSSSLSNAILFSLMIGISTIFHGGMIFFVVGLPLYILISAGKNFLLRTVGVLFVMGAFFAVLSFFEVAKLSELQQSGLTDDVISEMDSRRREAGTAYLTGMSASGPIDLLWQLPVRSVFLLLTPFPWQIGSFGHLIVAFDALFWWAIIWIFLRNVGNIWSNPSGRILFLCLLFVLFAFAFGTSNFGTAVRHRAKFIILGLALVAPFLPRFRFSPPR